MKYSTAQNMAAGLRNLADFIEEFGTELPSEFGCYDPRVSLHIYGSSEPEKAKTEALAAVGVMKMQGIVKKDYDNSGMTLRQSFGKSADGTSLVNLSVRFTREAVCKKVVVETKRVPKKEYVEVPGQFVDEEVVEWECEPLLS